MRATVDPAGVSPLSDWLKTFTQQPFITPEMIWNTLSPERKELLRKQAEKRRQKRREMVLQNATPEELAKIPRARLVRALAHQKLVFTVSEMAAFSGLDIETIRRRVKDGTLPKVPSVRVIYVYHHHFIRWLRGENKKTI